MNKNFILFDKNNNVQRTATAVVKFNFEGKDYLIYSVEENEQNDQIFVSRIVLNSEGKTFIDNILPDEKGKINNIVYNIVILVPSEAQKGATFETLSSDLRNKYFTEISLFSSVMDVQEYFNECSVAITSKILVDTAIKFYEENLNKNLVEVDSVPTWTSPVEVTAPVPSAPVNEEIKTPEPVIVPVQEPIVQVNVQSNVVEPVSFVSKSNLEDVSNVLVSTPEVAGEPVSALNTVPFSAETSVVNQVEHVEPVNVNNVEPFVSEQETNQQIEKLVIVSDPSLGLGVSQPNVVKNRKAGFANSKYVVVGTICLVLAIAVVIVAYFLITNMK